MNFNFYIFGNPGGQYGQYPQDYTEDILAPLCEGVTQARGVIYRRGDLMHYVLIEDLGDGRYAGVCVIFNKIRVRYPKRLFELLRDLLERRAIQAGKYLKYATDGSIVFTVSAFSDDLRSYDYLKSVADSSMEGHDEYGPDELTTHYSGEHKTEYATWRSGDSDILRLSDGYDTVVVEDKHGELRDVTRQIIASLRDEVASRDSEIARLTGEMEELTRQKKQWRRVMILTVLVLGCGAGLLALYLSLSRTESDLQQTAAELAVANDTIAANRVTIDGLYSRVERLETSLTRETQLKEEAQAQVARYRSAGPFVVTGDSYSFGEGRYTCDYYTEESGSRAMTFKVIEESTGNVVMTRGIEPYLDAGGGSFTVYTGRILSSSKWYVFELWYGHRLVGGSRH